MNNYITINFDDSKEANKAYTQLKKLYPKNKIEKKTDKGDKGDKGENPAIRAMQEFQEAMTGKFEEAGIYTEEDIIKLCKEVRNEIGREKRGESSV